MSRRHRAEKREINPDAKYGDVVLTKFMNSLMLHGKKSIAEKILYAALDQVESKISRNPVEVFHEALENVMPAVEVRSRRVGGATYQVPVEVRADRKAALAIRWLIAAARARGENTMVTVWQVSFWMPLIIAVMLLKNAKIRTVWRRPTVPSHIIAGN